MEFEKFKKLNKQDKRQALFSLSNQMGVKRNEAYFAALLDLYVGVDAYSYYTIENNILTDGELKDLKEILIYFKNKNLCLFSKEKTCYYRRNISLSGFIFNIYQQSIGYAYKDKTNHSLFIDILKLAQEMDDNFNPKDISWEMIKLLNSSPEDKINPVFNFLIKEYGVSILNCNTKHYYKLPLSYIITQNRKDYYQYLLDNDSQGKLQPLVKKSIYELEKGTSALYEYIVESMGIEKEKKYINKVVKKVKKQYTPAPSRFKL